MLAQKNLSSLSDGREGAGILKKYIDSNRDLTVLLELEGNTKNYYSKICSDVLEIKALDRNRANHKGSKETNLLANYLTKTPKHLFDITKIIELEGSTVGEIVECGNLIRGNSDD